MEDPSWQSVTKLLSLQNAWLYVDPLRLFTDVAGSQQEPVHGGVVHSWKLHRSGSEQNVFPVAWEWVLCVAMFVLGGTSISLAAISLPFLMLSPSIHPFLPQNVYCRWHRFTQYLGLIITQLHSTYQTGIIRLQGRGKLAHKATHVNPLRCTWRQSAMAKSGVMHALPGHFWRHKWWFLKIGMSRVIIQYWWFHHISSAMVIKCNKPSHFCGAPKNRDPCHQHQPTAAGAMPCAPGHPRTTWRKRTSSSSPGSRRKSPPGLSPEVLAAVVFTNRFKVMP